MAVWYCIPSKKSAAAAQQCIEAWRRMGYKVAIWRDAGDEPVDCDLMLMGKYEGYAAACNALAFEVMDRDERANWLVFGGDDIWPDPNNLADDIAAQCSRWFRGTFGCMQPVGDRWGEDLALPNQHPQKTAYIDRVLGSPWMGRDYCKRMYGGNGPWFEGYRHMFVDEEAWHVAQLMGVLWQRRDLKHEHKHWAREGRPMPAYLKEANSPQHWNTYQQLFETRKASGFPGHEPTGVALVTIDATQHFDNSDASRYEFRDDLANCSNEL